MFKVVAASFVASALALAPPSSSQQQQQKAVDRRSVGAGLLSALGASPLSCSLVVCHRAIVPHTTHNV